MSKVILTTISDDRQGRKGGVYSETQDKIEQIFRKNPDFGITDYQMWKWGMIKETAFYKNNLKLLSNPDAGMNGRAYKPFVIFNALENCNEGDYVIYTDCSPEMWNIQEPISSFNINILKSLCMANKDILTAFVKWDAKPIIDGQLGLHIHKYFTLDICMDKMGCSKYRNSFMHASGMFVIRKTALTLAFAREWLKWNTDEDCATLLHWESEKDNKIGHRHDQSISGLLLNKMNHKFVDILHNSMNPYNFLQFCRYGVNYSFIDSNTPVEDTYIDLTKVFVRPTSRVRNEQGTILNVYRVEFDKNGIEKFIVGQHEQSCYETTRDKITLV